MVGAPLEEVSLRFEDEDLFLLGISENYTCMVFKSQ